MMQMKIIGFIFLISTLLNGKSFALHEFRAGIIMVEKSVLPFKMEMVGPAIDMAINVCEEEFGIRFIKHVALYPTWCNSVFTAGAVADLKYQYNISVLIGPGCSSDITICAKTATYYDLPQVTGVGDLLLGKKDYPTLTRLSYSLEKQSGFITSVLEQFKWKHVAIIYDTFDILMRIQGSSLVNHLRNDPNYPRPYDIPFQADKERDLDAFAVEAGQHARVIIFLGSGEDLRQFMLFAHARGMTSGEYVFITIELFRSEAWGDFSWKRGDAYDSAAKEAYKSLIIFTLTQPQGPKWNDFAQEVIMRAKRDYNFDYGKEEVNYFVGAFYNSVLYLGRALNATIEDGEDPYNGLKVAQKLWNSTFPGIFGEVFIDEIGDRIADYSLLDMTDRENGTFEVVAMYFGAGNSLTLIKNNPIHWPGGQPPLDVPKCGFKGDHPSCNIPVESNTTTLFIVTAGLIVFMIVSMVIGLLIFRKLKFEAQLSSNRWKIKMADVVGKQGQNAFSSKISLASTVNSRAGLLSSKENSIDGGEQQIFTRVGTYGGAVVAIRKIHTSRLEINRRVLLELKNICDCQHDNLVRFIGACVEPQNIALFMEYCPKGSLQDILANDAIKLDWLFKYSLLTDIVKGLSYIHTNPIQVHGRLSSSNCVVDNRFVLKLTDCGLPTFYNSDIKYQERSHSSYRARFWRAPELLKYPAMYTQSGDLYSFGIIVQEIITRREPYDSYDMEPNEIIDRVHNKEYPPFRPQVEKSACSHELYHLMEQCWSDEPVCRPKTGDIIRELKLITKGSGLSGNILDNLLSRMEQYAENLETLVENRTQAFLDEKRKSEELLYRVLPKYIANQLKRGQAVQPEAYENVTIYFSDVVGFTRISAGSTPMQVVDFLNDLYTCFDAIIDSYDVYKVETIGDAYMVASGLPLKNGNQHAVEIACMAQALLNATKAFKIRHMPDAKLKVRIGLHSGPVVAGVVGLTMPRYCLFGDTVNTASRMESNGEAEKIHISNATKEILDTFGIFMVSERGEISVKGKGMMRTYWLDGKLSNTAKNSRSALVLTDF